MSERQNSLNLAERYHIAKLVLTKVRFLAELQDAKLQESIDLYKNVCKRSGHNEDNIPPLIDQGTFISMAYICMVWLWEAAKGNAAVVDRVAFETALFDEEFPLPDTRGWYVTKPDKRKHNASSILRVIRNALSHGSVEISDNEYIFMDINPRDKNDYARLAVPWHYVGQLCERMIFKMAPYAYPAEK